ncbi:hypothetical protein ABZ896_08415 [Streptomyces sp. NPDC047072]
MSGGIGRRRAGQQRGRGMAGGVPGSRVSRASVTGGQPREPGIGHRRAAA